MDISPVPYSPGDFSSVLSTLDLLKEISSSQFHDETVQKSDIVKVVEDHIPEKTMRNFIVSNLLPCPKKRFRWTFNIDDIHDSKDGILGFPYSQEESSVNFNGPTMIMRGSKSTFVRSSHFQEVQRLFPNYHLVSVRDAGHWIHFDQPEESATRVSHFLKAVKDHYKSSQTGEACSTLSTPPNISSSSSSSS